MGLSLAAAASSIVALIMQVLQVLRGWRAGASLFLDLVAQKGRDAEAMQKADWLHILSAFPLLPPGEKPLSLIPTVGNHGMENKL